MIYIANVPNLKKWDEPEQIKTVLEELDINKDKIVGLNFVIIV